MVIAANLRENPTQTSEIVAEETMCGYASSSGYVLANSFYLETAVTDETGKRSGAGKRSFCAFKNFLPFDARLFRATLLLYGVDGSFAFKAEPLDFGTSLEASDYWLRLRRRATSSPAYAATTNAPSPK